MTKSLKNWNRLNCIGVTAHSYNNKFKLKGDDNGNI